MKLYDMENLPNARRVRMFLAEKGLSVPIERVDLRSREALDMRSIEPVHLVADPVLELDNGARIDEAMAICGYLEEIHPDPPLFGVGPLDRALVRMWQRRTDWRLSRFVWQAAVGLVDSAHPLYEPEAPIRVHSWAVTAKALAQAYLAVLDQELGRNEFVAGSRFTIADIAALCAIDLGEPLGIGMLPEQKHLRRWHDLVCSRPSARA